MLQPDCGRGCESFGRRPDATGDAGKRAGSRGRARAGLLLPLGAVSVLRSAPGAALHALAQREEKKAWLTRAWTADLTVSSRTLSPTELWDLLLLLSWWSYQFTALAYVLAATGRAAVRTPASKIRDFCLEAELRISEILPLTSETWPRELAPTRSETRCFMQTLRGTCCMIPVSAKWKP